MQKKNNSNKSHEKKKIVPKVPNDHVKRIPKDELERVIISLNGNVSDITEYFGYKKDCRNIIYRAIAKYDLVDTLKTARGYEKRMTSLLGDIAVDITLDTLLKLTPGELQKQDVVLLIFILKSCAGFMEARLKDDDKFDDSSIDNLVNAINKSTAKITKDTNE